MKEEFVWTDNLINEYAHFHQQDRHRNCNNDEILKAFKESKMPKKKLVIGKDILTQVGFNQSVYTVLASTILPEKHQQIVEAIASILND